MSNEVAVALTAAISSAFISLVGVVVALVNRRQATAENRSLEIKIDGRLTELLEQTRGRAMSEGLAQGQADERANPQSPVG